MKNTPPITIWDECDPTVADAIRQFEERWRPYSTSSRHYPIVGLIQEIIDPAVEEYAAKLPMRYLRHIPGAGTGVNLSEIIRLVGLDATVRLQRQLLRSFVLTKEEDSARDRRFAATLESLVELVWACACKRPVKSQVRDTRLNGERPHGFCQFCGELAELTLFSGGSDDPKADDPDEKLRLSSLYCQHHRPKLPNGTWNPEYRKAKRSLGQFDTELTRLSQQCAKPAMPQANTGDQLVDGYIFHYVAGSTLQPADKVELRNQARLMVDVKLTDRKKQMLMLQWSGFNQSEIARKLGVKRQAVSKALASIPNMFHLRSRSRTPRQPN